MPLLRSVCPSTCSMHRMRYRNKVRSATTPASATLIKIEYARNQPTNLGADGIRTHVYGSFRLVLTAFTGAPLSCSITYAIIGESMCSSHTKI